MEKYSVLMSVYFKEVPEYLSAAIESMLNQTVAPDDFVLVCDGPLTDELNKVVNEYEKGYPDIFNIIRLEKNSGLGLALRAGLEKCKNEIVVRMDSDDISAADRVEHQQNVMASRPECCIVGGQIAEFTGTVENIVGFRKVPLNMDEIKRMLVSRNPMNHVTVMMKKSEIMAVGNYCDFPGFEDYHLWSRVIASGRTVCNIGKTLCYVRVGEEMYGRRGGIKYFRQAKKFFTYLKNEGIISKMRCFCNLLIRFCGNVIAPTCVRSILYKSLLRKKYEH